MRDSCITCPWHGLRFDLSTGLCTSNPELKLTSFSVVESESEVILEWPNDASTSSLGEGVRTALVRYGATGQVGWFGTIHAMPLHRHAQVVVESALGLQLGEILIGDEEAGSAVPSKGDLCGELQRLATPEDLERHAAASTWAAAQLDAIEQEILRLGHQAAEVEGAIDQTRLVVWLLTEPDAPLGPLAVELAQRFGVEQVRFLKRRADETPIRYNSRAPKDSEEGGKMKGPGLRQKHDLDRIWECPACGHRERTGGDKTTLPCPKCQKPEAGGKTSFMKLVYSPSTAPRRSFELVPNTPVPAPASSILGEEPPRPTRKQALRSSSSSEPESPPPADAPVETPQPESPSEPSQEGQ